MTDDHLRTLSIDRYPDPACSYTLEESGPVVRAHNEGFEAVCNLTEGDKLTNLFDTEFSAGEGPPSFEQPTRLKIDSGKTSDSHEYLVRVIPPMDGAPGHLLFYDEQNGCNSPELGVDRVASVISHDLRNPLDVARARLRAGRELDCEEHFEHVEQAHDRMERIIQDVLTLAHGEDVVNPEEFADLGEVAHEAWKTVETNGATLDVESELPTALADRDRVGRLFENLFRNSIEHGAEHSAGSEDSITITVGRLDNGFHVADDGIGISEDDPERIFEPGYTSNDHGTGLGLAIVARIADLHGWSVDVTESASGGARFDITGIESE